MRSRVEDGERVTVYVDDGELVKYTPVIHAVLQRLGVPPAEVDDVTQETLVAAWSSMCAGRFRPLRGQPLGVAIGAWVAGIARHLAANERAPCRRRYEIACANPRALVGAKGIRPAPEDQLAAREALRASRRLRSKLIEVIDHVAVGCTVTETAAVLGIPCGTAWTRLCLARQELRRILADPHQDGRPRRRAHAAVPR